MQASHVPTTLCYQQELDGIYFDITSTSKVIYRTPAFITYYCGLDCSDNLKGESQGIILTDVTTKPYFEVISDSSFTMVFLNYTV